MWSSCANSCERAGDREHSGDGRGGREDRREEESVTTGAGEGKGGRVGLARRDRLLYCLGFFGFSLISYYFAFWLQKFYVPGMAGRTVLLTGGMFSLAVALGRLTDGVYDPTIGYWSDRTRTRWGRRKPFMLLSIPVLLVTHLLLWHPPTATASGANFAYLLVVQLVYFMAFTGYAGPYLAMLPELAETAQDRASLATMQGLCSIGGLIAGGVLTTLLLPALGFPGVAWVLAGLALVTMPLPLFISARHAAHPPEPSSQALIPSIAAVLHNRPFRIYLVSQVMFQGGMYVMVSAMPYLVQHRLHWQEGSAGALSAVALLSGLCALPGVLQLSRRRGLKLAFLVSVGWFALTLPLLSTLGMWSSDAMNSAYAYFLIIVIGLALGGLFAVPFAILANITDYDRARTGVNRQALYFGVQGTALKAAQAGAPALALTVLFLGSAQSGQPPAPLGLTLLGPVTGVVAAISFLMFLRFPEHEVEAAVKAVHAGASAAEPVAGK